MPKNDIEKTSLEWEELLNTLKSRFENNMNRHKELEWDKVLAKLESRNEILGPLSEMENTGGEPDIVGYDKESNEYIFTIVHLKLPPGAEAFVMIRKRWIQEKNINPKIVPLEWQLKWAFRF